MTLGIGTCGPVLQKLYAPRIRKLKKEMFRGFEDRSRLGQSRVGVDQVGGRVDCATGLARVAVLVLGVAFGALALDVAVWQKHAFDGIKKLFDLACFDQSGFAQLAINTLRQLDILGRVSRVPVIKFNMKALQILGALSGDPRDQLLGCDALCLGLKHDGCAVRVIRTDKMYRVSRHAHRAHPDIRLDVFHDVADME